ncbi:MAG: condensation domain-containing protein, partial [Verrucomicrobiota bacterium]
MKATAEETIQSIYPLSPAQQGMLFHSLSENQSGVYIVQVGFNLRGPLNPEAFKAAWGSLVCQHDVLRTAFVWKQVDAPVQVVGRNATPAITLLDWQDKFALAGQPTNPGDIPDYLEWLRADRRRGFDPRAAPLMRIHAIRLAPELTRVVWTYHHLILDGWSLPLLFKAWVAAYQTERDGIPASSRGQEGLPFATYINWLNEQPVDRSRTYWQNHLGDFNEPTLFGIKSDNRSDAGVAAECRRLSASQTDRLQNRARKERVTLSTIVQGAWALLLSHHSGKDDVVFGVARSGRSPDLPG